MADAESSPRSVTYESDFIGDSEDEGGGSSRKRKRLKRLLRRVKANPTGNANIPQMDVVSSSDGEEAESVRRTAEKNPPSVEGLGKEAEGREALSAGDVRLAEEGAEAMAGEDNPSDHSQLALAQAPPPSQQNSGSQRSSEGGNFLDLSLELTSMLERSRLEDVAVNSDDSLQQVSPPPGGERDITAFELSGTMLHVEGAGEDSRGAPAELPGTSPGELPSLEVPSTPSETPPSSSSGAQVLTLHGSRTIRPKAKPPSYREVKATISEFAIPETVAQVPFYSDASDVSKGVEVGERVLRVENYSIAGLKSHVSDVELLGTEERRARVLNCGRKGGQSVRAALVGTGDVFITPLRRPPTWEEVCGWSQEEEGESADKEEKKRTKLRMPRSPGQEDSDDEMDLSVTLTSPGTAERGSGANSPEGAAGPSGLRRPSLDDSSASTSPGSLPEDVRHSTPCSPNPLGLRKGPAHKIKGAKRVSLLKKLPTIAEEERPGGCEVLETSGTAASEEPKRPSGSDSSFGIRGVTLDNTYGFKGSVECLQDAKAVQAHEHITTLIVELHVQTRGSLRPDPQHDPIRAVFYTLLTDAPDRERQSGVLAIGEGALAGTAAPPMVVHYVPDEKTLLDKVVDCVRLWDPDILAGYEIEMQSWGYLFQRSFVLEKNLYAAVGRIFDSDNWKELPDDSAEAEFDDIPRYLRQMRVTGRIVLDVWRLLRHEVALTSYTFESVMYHLLHVRLPKHSHHLLSHLWELPTRRFRHVPVEYFKARTEGVAHILDHLDFISRNSELARLFGIQFYEVLSRGSQFRVESMLLRLSKPRNFVPCSPSIRQRAAMRAPASLPLIMEPESKFYADPVVVLDFQSLYPSMIIAYNYCFSTCLGRVELLGGREPFEFGCTHLQISPEEVKKLEKDINISPAGIAFVRANVRKGVLPSMLEEILETRLMVKKSMKENKENKILQKVLHARQLGLKLIANVTYGYTAANFSGRMPCIEVGDSVVSKGRETLQRAIELVKSNAEWGAKVVYGDTDSLFVLLPGRTRAEAFRIGGEIAEAVTRDNPKPVKLKLEKVYQPSILQTKKRYVGYMYETPEQERPVYDAKGIETVRRDGCPATKKILQKALQILFETKDVSLVKKYTVRQFAKLFQGRVNTQDLIFAKEYRGRRGYRPGACVPALELAKQWTQVDRRAEPRVKERVPYVIVNGPPGVPLIRLVRSPHDLLADRSLRINAVYYITKAIIPPMQRCFSLLGADVLSWYADMPRKFHRSARSTVQSEAYRRNTISQFFATVECAVCSEVTNSPVCAKCQADTQKVALVLHDRIRRLERSHDGVTRICGSCCGRTTFTDCESLDCPVLYRRHGIARDLDQVARLRQLAEEYLQ